jgi:tetratricopeptide (TPR) repeat protein
LDQINELNQQSHNIGNLLKLLSFLDPENIPVGMVVDGAKARLQPRPEKAPSQPKRTVLVKLKEWRARKKSHTKGDADIATTTHLTPEFDSLIALILSPIEFQTAIQKLQSLSLVEHRSHNGNSSLWIHDLIQFMVREHARKDGSYESWLQSSWSLVYAVYLLIDDPTLPQWWGDCERLVPHLQSLRDAWGDFGGTNFELTQAIIKIAKYFQKRGRYDEAEALSMEVFEEMEKHRGADHPNTFSSMNDLASVFQLQGRYGEAEAMHKRAVEGLEKHLGTNHLETLLSVNNLACVYEAQGRYGEAATLLKRALEGKEKHLGTNHPDTLKSVNNLAMVYSSQERYDEAEALHKRALEGREKLLGTNHPDTLSSTNNIALVYQSQGRYDEAEAFNKRALEGWEKHFGTNHPHTLVSMNNLALVYSSQGRYEEAEALHGRALEGLEKNLGANHPHTLKSMYNLASVFSSQGRCDEADVLRKRASEEKQRPRTEHS